MQAGISPWSTAVNMLAKVVEQRGASREAEMQRVATLEKIELAIAAAAQGQAGKGLSQEEWAAVITRDKVWCVCCCHMPVCRYNPLSNLKEPGVAPVV